MAQDKENNKPFRQTKKLILMALEDGWTQTAIAKKARVQQSVVSGWATGKSKAKEGQIQFLLEKYGDRLLKQSCHVYCQVTEYCRNDQVLASFLKNLNIPLTNDLSRINCADLRALIKTKRGYVGELPESELPESLVVEKHEHLIQVEAPVIFRFTFQDELAIDKKVKRVSTHRWLLHHMKRDDFLLVRQSRRKLSNHQLNVEERRRKQYYGNSAAKVPFTREYQDFLINGCNDEAGRWVTCIDELKGVEGLIDRVDSLMEQMTTDGIASLYDLEVLPFLLKKSLIEAGFSVKGVSKFTAY